MALLASLTGETVYLDTNVFILAIEGVPSLRATMIRLFSMVDENQIRCITSELTLAETLVRPLRDEDHLAAGRYRAAVASGAGLTVVRIDRTILEHAAMLRAHRGLKLPDAVHVATAELGNCGVLLFSDRRLTHPSIQIVRCEDLVE